MENVKPCPFCKSTRIFTGKTWDSRNAVMCQECGAAFVATSKTLEELIAKWNARASQPEAAPDCGKCHNYSLNKWNGKCPAWRNGIFESASSLCKNWGSCLYCLRRVEWKNPYRDMYEPVAQVVFNQWLKRHKGEE